MAVGSHILPTELVRTCADGFMYCMAEWAFDVTQGLFWVMALLSFCIIIFMATANTGTTRAFGFASIVGLIGSTYLAVLQLMVWWIASTFILVGVIGVASLVMSDS